MDAGGRVRGRGAPGAGPGSETLAAAGSGRTFNGRQRAGSRGATTSAQPVHPDCDSPAPGGRSGVRVKIGLPTGCSSPARSPSRSVCKPLGSRVQLNGGGERNEDLIRLVCCSWFPVRFPREKLSPNLVTV